MNSYWPDTRAQLGKTVMVAAGSVYDPSNGFLMVVGRLDYKKESRSMVDKNTTIPSYTVIHSKFNPIFHCKLPKIS